MSVYMRPLHEFIKIYGIESTKTFEIPENGCLDHFFIEFELNGETAFINERYGKYDGQIEIVSALAEEIRQSINTNNSLTFTVDEKDLEGCDGVFYNKLTIIYDPNRQKTGYIAQNNFDKETQKLKEVYILLSAQKNFTKTRIRKSLMHELTHAWHDYCSFIGKGTSLSTLGKESKTYNKLRTTSASESGKQFCKSILYLTTSFEKGAYSSEIYGELDELNNKIISWQQAKEIFHKSSTYNQILSLYNELKAIENKSDKFKNDFVNFYNEMNNSNLSLNKISKKLTNKLEKLFDKIESNCAKIYYEWSQNQQIKEEIDSNIISYYDLEE